jgi:hypothetical protein
MAVTTNADMRLVPGLIETGYSETVTQAVDAFFSASNGAVVKETVAYQGDTVQHNYFKEVGSLVSRRINQGTGSDAAATPLKITEASDTVPRLARKIGPVAIALGAMRARNMDMSAASVALGQQVAKAELANQINSAAASLVGAISAKTGAFVNNTLTAVTTKTLNYSALVDALALFGDASNDIVAWLMPSKPFFDLVRQSIDPTKAPDQVGAAAIYTGMPGSLGRPIIVTDAPALTASTDYWCFGLRAGAIQIKVDQMPIWTDEITLRRENIEATFQGELDYICRILGYRYTNAGANPADAALGTTANWTLDATSVKHAAGVALKVD